jgi:hypothetical protein
MWLGRFTLGQVVPLSVWSIPLDVFGQQSGAPVVPDNVPSVFVWEATTKLKTLSMPVADKYRLTGFFSLPLRLDNAFATGNHYAVYKYTISGVAYQVVDYFEVMAGGGGDGEVVAMQSYNRPEGTFIIRQLSTGILVAGRNPQVDVS